MAFCQITIFLGIVSGAILEFYLQANNLYFVLEEFLHFVLNHLLDSRG